MSGGGALGMSSNQINVVLGLTWSHDVAHLIFPEPINIWYEISIIMPGTSIIHEHCIVHGMHFYFL